MSEDSFNKFNHWWIYNGDRISIHSGESIVGKLYNNKVYAKYKEKITGRPVGRLDFSFYLQDASEYVYENYETILMKQGFVINAY